jgi:hypothetical protein
MSGRRGQAAALVAMMIFVIVLFIAMATNIGTLVNDRIRMQETADLATYAVAYSEAATLNELVELNQEIVRAVEDCRDALSPVFPGYPCVCGYSQRDPTAENVIIPMCKMQIDMAIMNFVQRASYAQSVSPALAAGRATARANFDGSENGLTFFEDRPGSPTAMGTYTISPSFNSGGGGGGTYPSIANFVQVADTKINYQVMHYCGECVYAGNIITPPVDLSTWFYKETDEPDLWVAGRASGTPEKRFLDIAYSTGGPDGGYFGASSTGGSDKLVSYAVAKPYDGAVGPTRANTLLKNGNSAMVMGVYSSQGAELTRELTMVDAYRARLAGIQDSLAGATTPANLVQQDASNFGTYWDMDKFKH